MAPKIWTLKEAREILPDIQRLTRTAHQLADEIQRALDEKIHRESEMEKLEDDLQAVLNQWAQTVLKYGVEVKGLWLVDFDNGEGYYCWRLGEDDILYEHSYEAGFSGRRLIQEDGNQDEK